MVHTTYTKYSSTFPHPGYPFSGGRLTNDFYLWTSREVPNWFQIFNLSAIVKHMLWWKKRPFVLLASLCVDFKVFLFWFYMAAIKAWQKGKCIFLYSSAFCRMIFFLLYCFFALHQGKELKARKPKDPMMRLQCVSFCNCSLQMWMRLPIYNARGQSFLFPSIEKLFYWTCNISNLGKEAQKELKRDMTQTSRLQGRTWEKKICINKLICMT